MAIQGYTFVQRSVFKLEARFTLMQSMDIVSFYLQQDIQSAGYRGYRSCDSTLLDINHVSSKHNTFLITQPIMVKSIIAGSYINELPSKINSKITKQQLKYNTDLLFIKDVPKEVYLLKATMPDKCAVLQISGTSNITAGEQMAIADAQSIERFVSSRVIAKKYIYHQLPENTHSCLHKAYHIGSEIISLQQVAYYLAKKDVNATTYTLYRDDLANKAEGLIDGIEDFYAKLITTANKPMGDENEIIPYNSDTYIIGVEIGLLLSTGNKFFKSQEFLWRGRLHKFTDGALRNPFVFKVALRNVC